MINNEQMRLLAYLDQQVQSCTQCELWKNGRAKPYWSPASQFGLLPEAPGGDEVLQNTPLCGTTGIKFWDVLQKEFKLQRLEFFIVNSVNCRPMDGNKNGKPTLEQMKACSAWVRKYIRIIKPTKLVIMGRYALDSINLLIEDKILVESITEESGTSKELDFYGNPLKVIVSVHPSWALIYNKSDGLDKLRKSFEALLEGEKTKGTEGYYQDRLEEYKRMMGVK